MRANGVYMIDGEEPSVIGFIPTGLGAHGLYASRDSKVLYVSNRGEGSISLIDFATRAVVKKWVMPGGGSPDMGGVSEDGKVLWLAGRYHAEVYAIDTKDGKLLARIPVGREPHGLCIYPQPGRYSLGPHRRLPLAAAVPLARAARAPERVGGHAGEQDGHAEQGVARLLRDRFATNSQQPATKSAVVQGWPGCGSLRGRAPRSRRRKTNRQLAVSPKKMKSTAIM